MTYQLITARTENVLNLDDVKTYLNIKSTVTTHDALLLDFISSVQDYIENKYDLALSAETWELYLDDFPDETDDDPGTIEIWKWPISSITSVKYTDSDGNTQEVDSSNYDSDISSRVARIYPVSSYSWPDVKDTVNAVQIRFVTGFASPQTVPGDLLLAMKLIIGDWYDNREDRGRRYERISEKLMYKYKY